MKKLAFLILLLNLVLLSCKSSGKQPSAGITDTAEVKTSTDTGIVYKSSQLVVQRLSAHVYLHTSFLNTTSFGKVDCNGMVVVNEREAVVFDTPADNESAAELIKFVSDSLRATIKAIIPTHFHEDCVGGLESFYASNIPAYASHKTIALLQDRNRQFSKPFRGFKDSLTLYAGSKAVKAAYFGEGHTTDNIIGYFAEDGVVFGGCLIKAVGAGKGNLADANVPEWPATVSRLAQQLPQAEIVIPGHGRWGGTELFQYTIKLFD